MILVMMNEPQEKSNLELEWHGGLVSGPGRRMIGRKEKKVKMVWESYETNPGKKGEIPLQYPDTPARYYTLSLLLIGF